MTSTEPERIIIMGVSGSGKSSLGAALAQALNLPFIEGDNLHPAENIAKMHAGIALNDNDRQPWLQALSLSVQQQTSGAVVSCSALKKPYRDYLRSELGAGLRFICLTGSQELIASRLKTRQGHFMQAGLLASQFKDFENPEGEAATLTLSCAQNLQELTMHCVEWLKHGRHSL